MWSCFGLLCLGLCVLQHALQVTASRSSSPLSVILSFGETKNTKSAHRKVQKTENVQVGKLKGGVAKSRTSWTSTTSVPVVVDLNNTRHRNISFVDILNKINGSKNAESNKNMSNNNNNNSSDYNYNNNLNVSENNHTNASSLRAWRNITNTDVCYDVNGKICSMSELASYIVGFGYIPGIFLLYVCCRYFPIVIVKCRTSKKTNVLKIDTD